MVSYLNIFSWKTMLSTSLKRILIILWENLLVPEPGRIIRQKSFSPFFGILRQINLVCFLY